MPHDADFQTHVEAGKAARSIRATEQEIASAEGFLREQAKRREAAWFELWGGVYGLVCGLLFLGIAAFSMAWAVRFFFAAAVVGVVVWTGMRIRAVLELRRARQAALAEQAALKTAEGTE